jgi:hypothetical protein
MYIRICHLALEENPLRVNFSDGHAARHLLSPRPYCSILLKFGSAIQTVKSPLLKMATKPLAGVVVGSFQELPQNGTSYVLLSCSYICPQ